MKKYTYLATILLFIVSQNTFAEVMDKEPSVHEMIVWGIVGSCLALAAAWYKPWTLVLVLPLPVFFFFGRIMEVWDPYVGPAIRNEEGPIYAYVAYGLSVLLVIAVVIGFAIRRTTSQHNNRLKSDAQNARAP